VLVKLIWKLLIGLVASLCGAFMAQWIGIPLPWTLGPLLVIACLRLLAVPVSSASPLRNFGQWVIGLTLGLYFTPQVVAVVSSHWFAMIAGLLLALLLAVYGTYLLHKVGQVDLKTAWFSSAIGGANEMAVLAERYGVRPDLVASAHTVRVIIVVLAVPFACQLFQVSGLDNTILEQKEYNSFGLLGIALLTIAGGFIAYRLNIPNAWVLGPMFIVMLFTMNEIHFSRVPVELTLIAQLCIGWSLGDRFRPGFFNKAPRFLMCVVFYSATALALAFGYAVLLSQVTDVPLPSLAVSVAPGGIAEMAITAKVLQLGVPLVTAFQVSRMVGVVLLTGPLYQYIVCKLEKPSK
jgi:membrane AbrB-like protein